MTMTKTKQRNFNIGTVKITMETNGFPKGFILKRDLTLRECKHILGNLLGIELSTREDCNDKRHQEKVSNYKKRKRYGSRC